MIYYPEKMLYFQTRKEAKQILGNQKYRRLQKQNKLVFINNSDN